MHRLIFYIWHKLPKIFLIPFLPLSLVFFVIITIRKFLFTKILSRYTASSKIIIIGNIVVGGSGKTPFTIWLSNYLSSRKKNIAIVSSGYGSASKEATIITPQSKANRVGDEAIVLQQNTSANIVTSNNRIKSTMHIDNKDFDYIIHDDGLQHYKMNRNYEFIISKINKYHNNFLLPCGPFREPKFFHSDKKYIYSNCYDNELPGFYVKISRIRNGQNQDTFFLDDKRFTNCYLLTAIADSRDLINDLKKNNIKIESLIYPDHYQFSIDDIPLTNKPILVTEKDFAKLKEYKFENIYIVEQSVLPNDKLIKMVEELI